jgi:hypothetical protein
MSIPINLPDRINPGDDVSAKWANSIREAIARLARRKHPWMGGSAGGSSTDLPFTISTTSTSLIASAGTINGDAHAEEINTTLTNGTWYFRAKVVINSTTGAVTSTDVLWATTEAANTTTDFYNTIGTVDIVSGVPDSTTIIQNTNGPMLLIIYGTPTDKWGVTIY